MKKRHKEERVVSRGAQWGALGEVFLLASGAL